MSGHARLQRGERRLPIPASELLDDTHVGGLLARIRAVGCLIGAAADVDPGQIRVAGWLVEALAEEAQTRLREAVRRLECAASRRRTSAQAAPGRRS